MKSGINKAPEFDLYLDESGSFMETSKDPAERAEDDEKNKRKFPSQVAGLLVPRWSLTESKAIKILEHCHKTAGWDLPPIAHFGKYHEDPAYYTDQSSFDKKRNLLVRDLLEQLSLNEGFQPVRLVNAEGLDYGLKEQYHTNMVAELFIRLCRQKQREGLSSVSINLICAEVRLPVPRRFLTIDEYRLRLQEYIARAAVRRGSAADSLKWELASLDVVDANTSRPLQICDIISYASHDDFIRVKPTRHQFLKALGEYNWTLQLRDLLERVEQLRDEGSLGAALITLAESSIHGEIGQALQKEAEMARTKVLDELAAVVAPVRDSQLAVILSWLEQIITLQRSADLGYNVACWLRRGVEGELCVRMNKSGRAGELDWFSFALLYWALTASNHIGSLLNARKAAQELNNLLPSLAGRWEHTPLLMEGLIALAVHETDCLEFSKAIARMELVVAHYEELGKLFPAIKSTFSSSPIRSDMKAKALGTLLQCEILAGVGNTASADNTRRISEEAIQEFSNQDDKERQYQYRAHLECLCHNFVGSRKYLARSLRHSDVSHSAISSALIDLGDNKIGQGFALMHWLRIGAVSRIVGDAAEFSSFSSAFEQSGLNQSSWCEGHEREYPVHSILRRLAVINAGNGKIEQALASLNRLKRVTRLESKRLTLGVILLAAYAEVAALLWGHPYANARQLLDSEGGERLGIKQIASAMQEHSQEFPAISEFISRCLSTVNEIRTQEVGDGSDPQRLIEIGQLIGY
jgi:hypothetical protein